jgi:hypothetical protein
MSQLNLPIVEIDYYNCIWNKKILAPQQSAMMNGSTIPGGIGTDASNVWPITTVQAPPVSSYDGTGAPYQSDRIASIVYENFYTEEMYIRGGFNNNYMSLGVRAYLDEEEPLQQHRFNSIIYSGIFNSRTGINRTNEFPVGTNITRSANPSNGSIQKIYAEENNLLVLQENKCSHALIDKDAIYNAEGGGSITSSNQVLGEIVPYRGEFGISKNPESFAIYSIRKYFIDRNRNAVLRLSHDGLTEIQEYGMRDWFRDHLSELTDDYVNTFEIELKVSSWSTPGFNQTGPSFQSNGISPISQMGLLGTKVFFEYGDNPGVYVDMQAIFCGVREAQTTNDYFLTNRMMSKEELGVGVGGIIGIKLVGNYRSRVYGGWDAYNKQYIVSLQENKSKKIIQTGSTTVPKPDNTYYTLGYDEQVKGWPSFYSYKPVVIDSLKNTFWTVNNDYWNYENTSVITKGLYSHYANVVPHGQFYSINNNASVSVVANAQPSIQKVFLTVDYEGDNGWRATVFQSDRTGSNIQYNSSTGNWDGNWDSTNDEGQLIRSYVEGAYDSLGNDGVNANPLNAPLRRAGFDRKENRYVSNLINKSTGSSGEVIFGNQVSGLKGYFLDVTFSTDNVTNPGGMKELYSVGLTYNVSSM